MQPFIATTTQQFGARHITAGQLVWAETKPMANGLHRLGNGKSRMTVTDSVGGDYIKTLQRYDGAIDHIIGVEEAVEILGVNRQRVHQLATAGRIIGKKSGNTWFFDRRSVEARARWYR